MRVEAVRVLPNWVLAALALATPDSTFRLSKGIAKRKPKLLDARLAA